MDVSLSSWWKQTRFSLRWTVAGAANRSPPPADTHTHMCVYVWEGDCIHTFQHLRVCVHEHGRMHVFLCYQTMRMLSDFAKGKWKRIRREYGAHTSIFPMQQGVPLNQNKRNPQSISVLFYFIFTNEMVGLVMVMISLWKAYNYSNPSPFIQLLKRFISINEAHSVSIL